MLGRLLLVLLGLSMLSGIYLAVQQSHLSAFLNTTSQTNFVIPSYLHLCEEAVDQATLGLNILLAVSFVSGMFYLYLSHAFYVNLHRITPRYKSSRVFPGFLIPVINLVFPLLFTAETWQLSKQPLETQTALPEYKINLLFKIWWILCLLAVTLFVFPQISPFALSDSYSSRESVANIFTVATVIAASGGSFILFYQFNTHLKLSN
ncbi:DUF4328 domain-containing protein [Dehalococcoides mccartyi]|nr:DUF4328 domain-containing protein [Dehalococcoides mccartyi]